VAYNYVYQNYQIWWRSVKGFWVGEMPKFTFSHRLCCSSFFNSTVLRYRLHCDSWNWSTFWPIVIVKTKSVNFFWNAVWAVWLEERLAGSD